MIIVAVSTPDELLSRNSRDKERNQAVLNHWRSMPGVAKIGSDGHHYLVTLEGDYYVTLTYNDTRPLSQIDWRREWVGFLHYRRCRLARIESYLWGGYQITVDITDQAPPGWRFRTDITALEYGHLNNDHTGYLEHALVRELVNQANYNPYVDPSFQGWD